MHPNDHEESPFYGTEVLRSRQQEWIENFLKKYKNEKVSEELKEKIWDELQMEKHKGTITIPFKVVLRQDPERKYPDVIEVILDTKV